MSGPAVTFYRHWEAFPSLRDGQDDEIVVSVEPNAVGEGGNYEFMIEGVGSGTRHREYIGARVCLFDDSWRALTDLSDLFAALATKDTSAVRDWRAPRRPVSLDDVMAILSGLGYKDRTPDLAAQHDHIFRCSCGARPETGATS